MRILRILRYCHGSRNRLRSSACAMMAGPFAHRPPPRSPRPAAPTPWACCSCSARARRRSAVLRRSISRVSILAGIEVAPNDLTVALTARRSSTSLMSLNRPMSWLPCAVDSRGASGSPDCAQVRWTPVGRSRGSVPPKMYRPRLVAPALVNRPLPARWTRISLDHVASDERPVYRLRSLRSFSHTGLTSRNR